MKITDQQIIEAMQHSGGGFVSALGVAASKADSRNLERIKTAFPEYWRAYEMSAALRYSQLEREEG
tara:strand:- start:551 stop:748 length:198 start_codon:yes stop_codon:yes gene_type:complete